MGDVVIPLGSKRRCKHTGKYSALVSQEDAEWASGHNWTADISDRGQRIYAVRRQLCPDGVKRKTYMHREIWERAFGQIPAGAQIDHKDHGLVNGIDNRRANLRLADSAANTANQRLRTDNSSGYKGVSWNRKLGKWECYINSKCKRTRLGCFKTAEEAAAVYNRAAAAMHGEFARVNSIPVVL